MATTAWTGLRDDPTHERDHVSLRHNAAQLYCDKMISNFKL